MIWSLAIGSVIGLLCMILWLMDLEWMFVVGLVVISGWFMAYMFWLDYHVILKFVGVLQFLWMMKDVTDDGTR